MIRLLLSFSLFFANGLIALESFATPEGAIRLAAPKTNEEYARVLYESLHLADSKGLKRVFIVPPIGIGIAVAINDRLTKSAKSKSDRI